jgi:hypothetical protein
MMIDYYEDDDDHKHPSLTTHCNASWMTAHVSWMTVQASWMTAHAFWMTLTHYDGASCVTWKQSHYASWMTLK